MKKEEGWYSRNGMGVKHYVTESGTKINDGLHFSALCGAHSTIQAPWEITSGQRLCKRCWAARIKAGREVLPETMTTTTPESKDPKTSEIQTNYVQAAGEVTPITYIPVPDVNVIIDLLKRLNTTLQACRISTVVTAAVISELETRIHEAEERCNQPNVITTTYTGSKDGGVENER